jgi:hypothetical protein
VPRVLPLPTRPLAIAALRAVQPDVASGISITGDIG